MAAYTKLLLDTDIGSDIDDAVCLAYLLAQPACKLMGITTVTGQAAKRAMLASVLCKRAGVEVPIFLGVEKPLLVPQRQPKAPQARALRNWEHDRDFPCGQAVEFLRQTIRSHPGEITLLAIGPLTNVALLFAVDPEIPTLLHTLMLMCGVFTNRLAGAGPIEWNALCDPHATAIVYAAPVAQHCSVGLDVTCQVRMDASSVREKFQTHRLQPVLDFAEGWFAGTGQITFHDPLAAAVLFDEAICSFEAGQVEVELLSQHIRGMTHWSKQGETTPHNVALQVDRARFFEHFFSTLAVVPDIRKGMRHGTHDQSERTAT